MPPPPQPRASQLDGLRALAALGVLLAHFNPAPLAPPPGSFSATWLVVVDRLALGNLAVAFFFALSSFLLTWLARTEMLASGVFSARRFYVRRCLRIWPLYFTVLGLAFLLHAHPGRSSAAFGASLDLWLWLKSHLWLYLGFLSNWSLTFNFIGGHVDPSPGMLRILWSIAVEEQFYLLYPPLMLLALHSRRWRWSIIGAVLAASWAFRLWFIRLPLDQPMTPSLGGMYYASLSYGDIFLAGAAAGWLAAGPIDGSLRRWLQPWLGPVLVIGLILCGWAWRQHLWHPYTGFSPLLYPVAGGLFALFILWAFMNPGHPLCRALAWRPLRILSALSYGLYLWHAVSNTLLFGFVFPAIDRLPWSVDVLVTLRLALSVAAAVLFAAVSHLLIERPFLRLKSLWRPPGQAAT